MNAAIHHPGRVVAIGVAVAIALLALMPGTWGAALAQTAGTPSAGTTATPTATTVPAGESATIQAASDKTITIPAGALSEDATLTSQPIFDNETADEIATAAIFASLDIPTPDEVEDGAAVVISIFQLDATDADGNDIAFDEPVEMTFELTPEVLAAAGGDANNVVLQFFDEDTNQWTAVSCSGSGTTLTCQLPHFSVWALTVRTQQETGPGQAATPAPADTGMGATSDTGATNVTAIVLGIVALAGIAGVGSRLVLRRRA